MPKLPYLGELEMTALLVLARLGAPADGMAVYDEIIRLTGREVSAPTVYITLARLVRKELLVPVAPLAATGGGRALKRYALTAAGRQARERSLRMFRPLMVEPAKKGSR